MTDDLAKLADEMSRRNESRDRECRIALEKALYREVTGYLAHWLKDPRDSGKLCTNLLGELKSKLPV